MSLLNAQGSLQHSHRRCLREWQRTQRSQGLGRRAAHCELCHARYSVPPAAGGAASSSASSARRRSLAAALARSARRALADAARVGAWPLLALRVWRAYVLAAGAAKAVRVGAAGFAAGVSLGRALVEEQTQLLGGVLSSMGGLLGSPYAELLWAQAAGALLVGMASELVYCGVLVRALVCLLACLLACLPAGGGLPSCMPPRLPTRHPSLSAPLHS